MADPAWFVSVQDAIKQHVSILDFACRLDSIFLAAQDGQTITCEVRTPAEREPASGILQLFPAYLSGMLTRWTYYLNPTNSPFSGENQPAGQIFISRDGAFVLVWGKYREIRNPTCTGTALVGKDLDGTEFRVSLNAFRIS